MRKTQLIIYVALLSACASNPTKDYKQIETTTKNNQITAFNELVTSPNPIVLTKSEKSKFAIEETDPKMKLDEFISFYEIFQFNAEKAQTINITTYSYVKGLGKLYAVVPRLFIFSKVGTEIGVEQIDGKFRSSAFGPAKYTANWKATLSNKGQHYLIITSDNRVLDENIASYKSTMFAGTLIILSKHNFHAHLTGSMAVQIN